MQKVPVKENFMFNLLFFFLSYHFITVINYSTMYRLEYYNSVGVIMAFTFPNEALARWKKKMLMSNGYTQGYFKIVCIK